MSGAPRLLHVFYSLGAGGAQTRFVRIANRFGRDLEHAVVALNGDYSSLDRVSPEVPVRAIRTALKPHLPGRLGEYVALLEQVSPDCLITHNWGTIEWALARRDRIRHIHIEDGFGPDELNRQKLRRALFRRFALRGSDVVVPSKTLMRIAQSVWKIANDKLHYIPNGISIADFTGTGGRAEKFAGEIPVIGTVAALRPEKNIARLLDAFVLVNRQLKCELRIIGDGPERARLEALAARLGIATSVSFCGLVSDPRTQYADFDVFVLSSDTEQMPYTVLEAMAVGVPVVATDVGDVKAMVSGENAPLICSRNADALADGILRVLKEPQMAYTVSRCNRLKAQREYDIERMHEAFARLYGVTYMQPKTENPRS